jgi:hypothetical protein
MSRITAQGAPKLRATSRRQGRMRSARSVEIFQAPRTHRRQPAMASSSVPRPASPVASTWSGHPPSASSAALISLPAMQVTAEPHVGHHVVAEVTPWHQCLGKGRRPARNQSPRWPTASRGTNVNRRLSPKGAVRQGLTIARHCLLYPHRADTQRTWTWLLGHDNWQWPQSAPLFSKTLLQVAKAPSQRREDREPGRTVFFPGTNPCSS